MPQTKELQAALEAAQRAGQLIRTAYDRFQAIADAPADITTETDRHAQEAILSHLHAVFPNDALCAEEQTPTLAQAPQVGPRLWIVDPIDGTRGFARKNGEFSVMVAFVHEGTVELGIVLEPAKDRCTWGVRGGGCWRRDGSGSDERCRVSTTADLNQATLVQSHSKNKQVPSRMARAVEPGRVVESYSAGIKLALVARGEVDLYVNDYTEFHDWDIAAGHILVVEAGGTVTGMHGEVLRYGLPGAWQRAGLLGSNGLVHAAALKKLENVSL